MLPADMPHSERKQSLHATEGYETSEPVPDTSRGSDELSSETSVRKNCGETTSCLEETCGTGLSITSYANTDGTHKTRTFSWVWTRFGSTLSIACTGDARGSATAPQSSWPTTPFQCNVENSTSPTVLLPRCRILHCIPTLAKSRVLATSNPIGRDLHSTWVGQIGGHTLGWSEDARNFFCRLRDR